VSHTVLTFFLWSACLLSISDWSVDVVLIFQTSFHFFSLHIASSNSQKLIYLCSLLYVFVSSVSVVVGSLYVTAGMCRSGVSRWGARHQCDSGGNVHCDDWPGSSTIRRATFHSSLVGDGLRQYIQMRKCIVYVTETLHKYI
jgi:hypothetical protein